MRKLVLDPDALVVQSFDASAARDARGTVGAMAASDTGCPTNCLSEPCLCGLSDPGCTFPC